MSTLEHVPEGKQRWEMPRAKCGQISVEGGGGRRRDGRQPRGDDDKIEKHHQVIEEEDAEV